ncbi:glycosyltransferase family 39 protein [Helicobacter sp. XJK30-2]|uniref:Glycosyltransferase family 39 protein n=1 Tax=Helicobacter zhangjianzhongii TaxID=2974574 RepID=A0ACC6FRZ9_9HELI|nr:glycosyltransferase family 39 protein [Helicobacter sp. XJK30-2]MDL0082041.1 glycosyltransferase family 39 protein [Helicobacter sp. XJK30-2]
MNPQKFSLRESIVLYGILLGCFAVFCYMDWRYVDVEFLGLARGDEMEHFLELQSIYNGFITLNIKKIFTIGAYNYGFPYYMLNLLAALPFIITENYPLQIYAPRVLNALFSIANLWLLYKIARMYLSARLCVVVIGIFIAMSGFWHQGYIYKPDVFQAFFVLACAYYLLRDNFRFSKHYTLAWIALGLGMGVAKFQAILFIPMIYAYIFLCVREQGFWRSVKRAIVASFGVFAIWILTNPYLLHPRGFNAWYAMFEGNMNSNATNHGAYTQVSLGDKLAMIDFYYFEIVVFIVLLAVVAYYCFIAGKQAFLAPKQAKRCGRELAGFFRKPTPKSNQVSLLPFTPIAAGLLVSLIYLLFFVNKAWEAYYFSSIALAILVLSTLGTLRVSKLLGGGGSIACGAVCPNYRG